MRKHFPMLSPMILIAWQVSYHVSFFRSGLAHLQPFVIKNILKVIGKAWTNDLLSTNINYNNLAIKNWLTFFYKKNTNKTYLLFIYITEYTKGQPIKTKNIYFN
jgi:hypothetical protein